MSLPPPPPVPQQQQQPGSALAFYGGLAIGSATSGLGTLGPLPAAAGPQAYGGVSAPVRGTGTAAAPSEAEGEPPPARPRSPRLGFLTNLTILAAAGVVWAAVNTWSTVLGRATDRLWAGCRVPPNMRPFLTAIVLTVAGALLLMLVSAMGI